jgi:Arc/MetJ family transcription regulator
MRTNIEIDDALMQEAMASGGFKTKKETVEAALKILAKQRQASRKILELFGKIEFDPNYDYKRMRESKFK